MYRGYKEPSLFTRNLLLTIVAVIAITVIGISGCGYSEKGNELVGQVKKVKNITPIVCNRHTVVDISLGVMKNGTGSMSTQDKQLVVYRGEHDIMLKKAMESGKFVKVTYDEARVKLCEPDYEIRSVEILQD